MRDMVIGEGPSKVSVDIPFKIVVQCLISFSFQHASKAKGLSHLGKETFIEIIKSFG